MSGSNIYGTMVGAQLNFLASDPSNVATGLIYFNTVSVFPKWYTGALWKTGVDSDSVQTITNKNLGSSTNTLTGATAASFTNTGTVTLFTASDTVVGKATTDNLTNKNLGSTTNVLTGATAASFVNTGTVSLFTATDTVVGKATTDVLTNKDYDGGTASNTSRTTLAKAATATLAALTRKQGTVFYDTTLGKPVYDDGASLNALATAATATPTVAGNTTSYFPVIQSGVKTVSSAGYTILTTDGYQEVLVTTGASNRTIDLPAAASNTGRVISIVKVDSGVGTVIVDPNSSETISGATTATLRTQYEYIQVACDGTSWHTVASNALGTSDQDITRRGLKVYAHGGSFNGGLAPTVTLSGGVGTLSTVDLADFIPYQTADGNWRCILNLKVTLSATARTVVDLAVAGLTFFNIGTGNGQFIGGGNASVSSVYAACKNNSGTIEIVPGTSTSGTEWGVSGDVKLASKPTWAF